MDSIGPRLPLPVAGLFLIVILLLVYHANGGFLLGNDLKATTILPVSLLEEGNLTIHGDEAPYLFVWYLDDGVDRRTVKFGRWTDVLPSASAGGESVTALALRRAGRLHSGPAKYCLTATEYPGLFVNTFSIGAALAAVPVYALARPFFEDFATDFALHWRLGKLSAALAVAGSALFIFLIADRLSSRKWAWIVALVYALGTCVWSTASQGLWQHGPNVLFLSLGTYFWLLWFERRSTWLLVAAAQAFGLAVVCRPTSVLIVLAVVLYLWVTDRRAWLWFTLSGLPLAALLGLYNNYYLGSPWASGQTRLAAELAAPAGVWSNPFWPGLAGLLISPSRGLFIFSPVLLFAVWGLVIAWRDQRYRFLRPLVVGVLAVLLLQAKYFDWWGGNSYGYRRLIDICPILILGLLPLAQRLQRGSARTGFTALLLWSVVVQVVGAFAYDVIGWNQSIVTVLQLPGEAAPLEVDDAELADYLVRTQGARVVDKHNRAIANPDYRYRLWSISDNQIGYYVSRFPEARAARRRGIERWLADPTY